MKTLIDFIIRRRSLVLILILTLSLLLGYEMFKVRLNADFTTYLRQDDPLVQQFNYIGEEYASKSMALVLIEAEDVFNSETLKLIRNLTDAYEELDGVAYVTSLTNVLDFKKTEWGLEVGRLILRGTLPQDTEELKELKDYVLSKEMYVKDIVSEDGKSTVIVSRLMHGADEFELSRQIKLATEKIAPQNECIYFGGMPFLMYHMTSLILNNLKVLEPLMIFLILFILFLGFRKPGGIFLPLVVVIFSVVGIVGLMVLFGLSLDLLSGIMPVILIAMGSADGIHIMRRYYEKRQIGRDPTPAIKETFAELGIPIVITTVTTMIGFLSLLISNFSVIRQFGLVTALGIFLALVVTFLLFPALLSFSRPKTKGQGKPKPTKEFFIFEHWANLVTKNRIPILIGSGLIVILAIMIIPRIKKDVDWSLCLQKGSKAHQAEMLLRRDFGGTLPVQVLVKGNIKDPFTLKAMRYLERYLETVPSVAETQSMATVISEMNDVMNDRYVVPQTKEGVSNLWFLIEDEDVVEQMVKENRNEALIQAKLDSWHTGTLSKAVNQINRFIRALPERVVAVDPKMVPPQMRKALLEVRKDGIINNLLWDLGKREITVERERLEPIVEAALLKEGLKKDGYNNIRIKIIDYLISDVAEIEFISKDMAEAIADNIIGSIERNSEEVLAEEILVIVKSILPARQILGGGEGAEIEDMSELSQSLEVVVNEAIGEERVTSTLKEIEEVLPAGSSQIRDLFRDLRGDLWEMNEDYIALAKGDYQKLSESLNPTEVKEVSVSFENTGLAAVLKKMEEELAPTQIQSLLLALVLVAVILGLIFRSFAVGIIGIAPITLTVLVNFAVMGYFRIGLDSFTAMIASIAIGLGIDYAVHFTSCFRREFSKIKDELCALRRTLSTTGVAILINAFSVGLGFAVLLLAGGQHIRRFGGLAALTMLLSALFTLTVLPAITLLVKPKYLRKV